MGRKGSSSQPHGGGHLPLGLSCPLVYVVRATLPSYRRHGPTVKQTGGNH